MYKKQLINILIIFSLILTIGNYSIITEGEEIHGNIFYVGGSGEGNYSKIQDAINDCYFGDTIFVYNGTYYENLFINKTINLLGEDKHTTIIDGERKEKHDVIHILSQADSTRISGFTLKNSGQSAGNFSADCAIELHSDNNIISGNIITNNFKGIFIFASDRNNISNNIIQNTNYSGISFFSGNKNTISSNYISNNKEGILISNTGKSCENIIFNNHISNNFFGIKLFHSGNIVKHNNFINNTRKPRSCFNIIKFSPSRNSWEANYWDDWRNIGPVHIPGFLGFNFDRNPVSEPYDINFDKNNYVNNQTIKGDGDIKHWAIISVVGINPKQTIANNRDARAIKNLLISQGWDEDKIIVLIEEEATKEAILDTFRWLNDSGADEDDVILFCSESHGYYIEDQPPLDEEDGKDGIIIPFDCDWETWNDCITDDELALEFDKLKSKNIVAIINSCHSGEFIDGENDLCKSNRIILTSSTGDELTFFIYTRMHGLFAYYLLKGFKGRGNKNNDNWVSVEEAFHYSELPVQIRSTIFSIIDPRTDTMTQHPQMYDGWPTEEDNEEELNLISI